MVLGISSGSNQTDYKLIFIRHIALVRKKLEKCENIGQFMKSKQLPFIEKLLRLAILSVNSVYKFSEMCLL